MKRFNNFYWKAFFSAYWLAKDLGEKDSPEWNASGFVEYLCVFIFLAIIFFVNGFLHGDLPFHKFWILFSIIFPIVVNGSIIRSPLPRDCIAWEV